MSAKKDADYVLSIRLPLALKRRLDALADRESRSTANFIRMVLRTRVDLDSKVKS